MTAFDKNSVQVDYAFEINPIDEDETPVLACPRCGCLAERRHRSVCFSCKRRIPPMGARQTWEDHPKNPFEAVSPLVQREKAPKEYKFTVIKKSDGKILRIMRKVAPSVAAVIIALVGTPYLASLVLGEQEVNDFKAQLTSVLNAQPTERDIASSPSPSQ